MRTFIDKTNKRKGIVISISDAKFIKKNAVKKTDKWWQVIYRLDKFYLMKDVVIAHNYIESGHIRYSLKYSDSAGDILEF